VLAHLQPDAGDDLGSQQFFVVLPPRLLATDETVEHHVDRAVTVHRERSRDPSRADSRAQHEALHVVGRDARGRVVRADLEQQLRAAQPECDLTARTERRHARAVHRPAEPAEVRGPRERLHGLNRGLGLDRDDLRACTARGEREHKNAGRDPHAPLDARHRLAI
jgi:hypothetical protein